MRSVDDPVQNPNVDTTDDDRFIGLFHPGGISAIRIVNNGVGNAGLEVDHLQYGMPVLPPEPWTGDVNIVIDDGTPQRSMIRTISVKFSEQVTLEPGAITLETDEPNPVAVPFTSSTATVDGKTEVTLTFSGAGGSIDDGQFELTVVASKVHVGPSYMVADRVDHFFRLFGDKDGDGKVTFHDFFAVVAAFGSVPGDANYDDDVDVDSSSFIAFVDFIAVVEQLGKEVI